MGMVLWCKLTGGALLVLSGGGAGYALWRRRRDSLEQIRAFIRLLTYLLDAVRYKALPSAVLLQMAAQHAAFAAMGLEHCPNFAAIPIPPALDVLAPELRAGLAALETDPKSSACRTLEYLLSQCRAVERQAQAKAERARVLFPRLGGALGLVCAILLL